MGWGGGFDGATMADVIELLVKVSAGFETVQQQPQQP